MASRGSVMSVAALSVESAVLDGEAILLRPDNTSDFRGATLSAGPSRVLVG
jgi:hypothetical protein